MRVWTSAAIFNERERCHEYSILEKTQQGKMLNLSYSTDIAHSSHLPLIKLDTIWIQLTTRKDIECDIIFFVSGQNIHDFIHVILNKKNDY